LSNGAATVTSAAAENASRRQAELLKENTMPKATERDVPQVNETPAAAPQPAEATERTKRLQADIIITRHAAVAGGAGLIPMPLIDFGGIFAAQMNMLRLLCKLWDVKFSKQAATSAILSAAASAIPGVNARTLLLTSAAKAIPFIGTTAAAVTNPVLGAATTLAIGKLFVEHLESDGTLLTFRASRIKEYAKKLVADAEKLVKPGAKPEATPAAA
jgi:uncharacterized protein (DUF697 family)